MKAGSYLGVGRGNYPHKKQPLEERFWRFVEKTDTCWLWHGPLGGKGYGRFVVKTTPPKKTIAAHRFAYELLVGSIPEGLVLDHTCRVRTCCNPAHVEPVTHRTNILRGEGICAKRAAATHCKYGHEFTPENTRIYIYKGRIGRHCKLCTRTYGTEYYRANKDKMRPAYASGARRRRAEMKKVQATQEAVEKEQGLFLYSAKALADASPVSYQTVLRHINRGTIPAERVGKAYLITQRAFDAYIGNPTEPHQLATFT